jgi:hypothetical protein
MAKTVEWERNIWTGHDIARLSKNERVVRTTFRNPTSYLYFAEFWGDFSLKYPLRGPYRKTLQQTRADLARIKRDDEAAKREGVE